MNPTAALKPVPAFLPQTRIPEYLNLMPRLDYFMNYNICIKSMVIMQLSIENERVPPRGRGGAR